MLTSHLFPFYSLSNYQLHNEFQSIKEKLEEVINNSVLSDFLKFLKPYYHQIGFESKYFTPDEFNNAAKELHSKFSVFHLNIRSLNKHHNELLLFLSLLNFEFDCICLSEIWDYNLQFYKFIFDGYDAYFEPPKDSSIGGVAMFIKKEYQVIERKDLKIKTLSTFAVEDMWYEIIVNQTHKYLVNTTYNHPNRNINDFVENLDHVLSNINDSNAYKDCIITGDINIDLMKYETHDATNGYLGTMLCNEFMPTILLPTRVTSNTCTLIDHLFYYSKTFKDNFISGNLFTDITDHFANFFILGSPKRYQSQRPLVRIFSEKNKEKFKDILQKMNLNNKVKDKTVDQSMEIFYNELSNAYNRSFPYVRLSRKRAKDKPWVTTCLKRSINEKHKLFKKYLINRTPENEANYRNYSNKLRTIIRKAEINYYRKIFDQKENNIKNLWKHLGSFLNSPRKNTKVRIDKLLVNGKELTNTKDIADSLNNYFINIGTQLATKVNASDKKFHHYLKEPIENTIFLRPTNSYELLKELNSINNKKSTFDSFKVEIIKYVKNEIVPPVVHIINQSLSDGIMPKLLKIAKVIPVHKGQETNISGNYRPISLLSMFEKLIEKVMCNRLKLFLKKKYFIQVPVWV